MYNLTALTNKHRVIHVVDLRTQTWNCGMPVKPCGSVLCSAEHSGEVVSDVGLSPASELRMGS